MFSARNKVTDQVCEFQDQEGLEGFMNGIADQDNWLQGGQNEGAAAAPAGDQKVALQLPSGAPDTINIGVTSDTARDVPMSEIAEGARKTANLSVEDWNKLGDREISGRCYNEFQRLEREAMNKAPRTGEAQSQTTDADTVNAGTTADTLVGGAGNDSTTGGAGNDTLAAGTDTDTTMPGGANDTLTGGAGNTST